MRCSDSPIRPADAMTDLGAARTAPTLPSGSGPITDGEASRRPSEPLHRATSTMATSALGVVPARVGPSLNGSRGDVQRGNGTAWGSRPSSEHTGGVEYFCRGSETVSAAAAAIEGPQEAAGGWVGGAAGDSVGSQEAQLALRQVVPKHATNVLLLVVVEVDQGCVEMEKLSASLTEVCAQAITSGTSVSSFPKIITCLRVVMHAELPE